MRAFVAVEVPEEIRKGLWRAAEELSGSGASIVSEENMHVTLAFLGETGESEIARIKHALYGLGFKAFDAEIRGIGIFDPGMPRVAFGCISRGREGFLGLHSEALRLIKESGIAISPKTAREEYVPHVTLARFRRAPDRKKLTDIVKKYEDHAFGRFGVTGIKLKGSAIAEEGPTYSDLGEFEF